MCLNWSPVPLVSLLVLGSLSRSCCTADAVCPSEPGQQGPDKQSGGWGLVNPHCCPQFWRSKTNTVYWTLFWGFRADKTSTTHWSGGRVQVWVQVLAPADQCQCLSFGNHSQRLFLKTIEEFDCQINSQVPRIWLRNQQPSSWGRAPAQLGRVGLASTNTGRFRVGGSRCGQRQARLRKMCYHSCDTDSVRQSKRF